MMVFVFDHVEQNNTENTDFYDGTLPSPLLRRDGSFDFAFGSVSHVTVRYKSSFWFDVTAFKLDSLCVCLCSALDWCFWLWIWKCCEIKLSSAFYLFVFDVFLLLSLYNDNTICGKKHYIYLRPLYLFAAQRLHWKAAAHKQHNHHRRCVSCSRALSKHSCQNITSDDERQGDSAPVTELSMLPHSLLDINKACALAQEVSLCQLHVHLSNKNSYILGSVEGDSASVNCLWCLVREFVLENMTEDGNLCICIVGKRGTVSEAQYRLFSYRKRIMGRFSICALKRSCALVFSHHVINCQSSITMLKKASTL